MIQFIREELQTRAEIRKALRKSILKLTEGNSVPLDYIQYDIPGKFCQMYELMIRDTLLSVCGWFLVVHFARNMIAKYLGGDK